MKDHLSKEPIYEQDVPMVADGAYGSELNVAEAAKRDSIINMKNTKLAFCKFSKYPILKSTCVKFSRYKQKSMNVSVSFDTLIIIVNSNKKT